MKKERKSLLIPTLYLLAIFGVTTGIYLTKKEYDNNMNETKLDNITFVSNNILSRTIPIINIEDSYTNPFPNTEMEIARYYYHIDDPIDKKEKSLVYYNGTYMPNTGIDYINKEIFDVTSIYDGTVVDVMEDELLGKTVKIRHNNEIISVYQGLSEILVNKGDIIFQGQKIGSSGTSKLNSELGNHLHFEIYKNGETIDPLLCLGKKTGDI